MPYGTCRGTSSSRTTGLTKSTLATESLERRRGGVPAARQVVGVQARQDERLGQVVRHADPRSETDRTAGGGDDLEGAGVVRAERIAHHPVARLATVHLAEQRQGARLDRLAHALRQRGGIAAGAGQDEMDLMRR